VSSVTCIHAPLLALTLVDMGGRAMSELGHGRERVGRPSLALPRPILSRKHREQHDPILALSHRLNRRSSVSSVTCIHAPLLALTLVDMGGRAMSELGHGRERVGRPSLALPRPILSRKHREQHDPILALTPSQSRLCRRACLQF
jgi:hypothetical protein